MPLVNTSDLLTDARGNGYAIAALDVVSLDVLEAVIRVAET